jgi:phage terminase large subunit
LLCLLPAGPDRDANRKVDGRSIGYADPNYQSRYRITYKPRDASELPRDLYKPQEKQDLLHACSAPNIWYGGAAGGGKSHGLRWHGYINCMRRKGLKVLLLRRQFTELEQTHILEIPTEIPADVASYHGTLHRLTFKSTGSFIQFGHAHTDKAVRSYLSTAWDLILIDEAREFTPRMLSLLQSRARTKLAGIRPQMVIASNPGGEAHLWLVSRFITKKVDVKEDGNYKPDDYVFIQSLVGDNQYNDAFYVDRLRSMSEADREAFLFGNMDAFAGQYFREWSKTEHVIQKTAFGYGAPGDEGSLLEDWFEVEAGMDWGYSPSPGIVLWAAFDPFGRPTCYKELVFSESSPASVAQQIAERCTTEAEKRMTIRGDSQMWTKQVGTGVSIADEINDCFAQMGLAITLVQANKDRINGWARVHQYLDRAPPGSGGLGHRELVLESLRRRRGAGARMPVPHLDDRSPGAFRQAGRRHEEAVQRSRRRHAPVLAHGTRAVIRPAARARTRKDSPPEDVGAYAEVDCRRAQATPGEAAGAGRERARGRGHSDRRARHGRQ